MTANIARSMLTASHVLIMILLTSGCATTRPRPDDQILPTIVAVSRAATSVDSIWPGYRPFERGFILFSREGPAWLVAESSPPAPWIAVSSAEPGLTGRLYRREGPLPGLNGGIDLGYPVGARTYPAVENERGRKKTLTTLFHEAFHAYQRGTFAGTEQQSGWQSVPPDAATPNIVAAIEMERRILASALEAPPGVATDSLIAAFLTVRSERMAALPDSVRSVDRRFERIEGTAHLVGYRASATALHADSAETREDIIRTLRWNLSVFGGGPENFYFRWRSYGTGAAMGLLLDRLGVSWQHDLAAGASFDSLLGRAAHIGGDPSMLGIARRRFGYDSLLRRAGRDAVPRSEDPIGDFLSLEPYRLIVEIRCDSACTPRVGVSFSFVGKGRSPTSPVTAVMLLPLVKRASMGLPELDLAIEGRPLMIDSRELPIYRVVIMLPSAVRIDGTLATSMSPQQGVTHRITGKGTEIVVRSPALESVEVAGRVTTLHIRIRS
ncbi:MAG: hypothetical protein WKF55_07925 [Gemmatimonadaceae bacterium]